MPDGVNPRDPDNIDLRYGLEPAFDPSLSTGDVGTPGGVQFHLVECPCCGEGVFAQTGQMVLYRCQAHYFYGNSKPLKLAPQVVPDSGNPAWVSHRL